MCIYNIYYIYIYSIQSCMTVTTKTECGVWWKYENKIITYEKNDLNSHHLIRVWYNVLYYVKKSENHIAI